MTTSELAKILIVKFGIQPSEIGRLTMAFINDLMEENGSEVITLADTAALHRFLSAGA